MAGPTSLAQYYREHREAFLLAQELGCTPREAKRKLRDQARARRRACGTLAIAKPANSEFDAMDVKPAEFSDWRAPWMMRD